MTVFSNEAIPDWTGRKVKCIDPVETDMFKDEIYTVEKDTGQCVIFKVNGLWRLYKKTRFEVEIR